MADKDSAIPLGVRLRQLWRSVAGASDWTEQQKLIKEAHRIEDIVVSRNVRGIQFEKAGETGKAVELYEANIRDRFDGSHPYDRLRVIYSRQDKFEDAVRVCQDYIEHGQDDLVQKAKYRATIEKLAKKAGERA